jgi:hypothetical protein
VPHDDEAILVTTAGQSPVDERNSRERRYLITMGVRVVAFVAAIFFAPRWWWASAIAIALALVLPWFAVIAANAPSHLQRNERGPTLYQGEDRPELRER